MGGVVDLSQPPSFAAFGGLAVDTKLRGCKCVTAQSDTPPVSFFQSWITLTIATRSQALNHDSLVPSYVFLVKTDLLFVFASKAHWS